MVNELALQGNQTFVLVETVRSTSKRGMVMGI